MEQINKSLSLQSERLDEIRKAQVNYGKSPKARINLAYVQTRLEILELKWNSFKTTHEYLVQETPTESRSALSYFNDDLYETCEEIYINYKSDLKTKMTELSPVTPTTALPENKKTTPELKLPTINIPQFSGKYTEWPSFHDLFNSIIHTNKSIDDVQKLHYLKSSLSGEAEQLLRTITVTSQNYNEAWEILKNRYNNKRYISNSIFKKLFSIKNITTESAYQIKYLLDTTVECLSSLRNLGLPIKTWDAIMIYITVSKLDTESHRLWEQHIASEKDEFPSFDTLKDFLETRFRSLEMIEHTTKPTRTKAFHTSIEPTNISCAFCKENHYIYQCKQFAKLQYKERHSFVQDNNLCFNCLIPNHSSNKCMRKTSCRVCHKKHHSLLHPEKRDESVRENCHKDSSQNIVSHFVHQPGQILLATALVDVTSRQGQKHVYRALIDQGSQASFVTEDIVQTLGLKKIRINGVVSGLSEGKQLHTKYMVEVQLQSRHNTTFTIPVKAYILKSITTYLPQQSITISNWPELEHMTLADPKYNTPDQVHLLLGADVYSKIIEVGLIKSPSGIIAQKTQLGWILSGDTSNTQPVKQNKIISMHVCVCENDLLRKFWEVENEVLTCERKLSRDEQRCEDIYNKTTVRTESGRYKVNLPFKENVETPVEKCGNTKEIAISRFLQLERKLEQKPKMKEEYTKVIKEYEELGHMALTNEDDTNLIFLPHHAVIREDKDTTKLRVVFDASAKGSKGQSLNDTLLTGPVIQDDLRTLITKWRQHKIALISDITKMYRQILVQEKDTYYQCIVWRDNPKENCRFYRLLTVTFGTACAPYLAVRTLMKAAEDESDKYPEAAEIVKTSFYMDDLMTGASTEKQAIEIYEQVNKLLESAGFILQKWSSNSDNLLQIIQQNKEHTQPFEIKLDKIIKILGVAWDRNDDQFKISVNLPEPVKPITKRRVLSDVARLFDPFGWLAPVIIKAKVIIQKLWLCSSDWDEEIPSDLLEEWLIFRQQLLTLQNLKIDRWIHTHPDNDKIELVGFADASTAAYAAVLYVRVIQGNEVYVTILESKTKVAPLKQISIARLELCAAVLLAKLLAETSKKLKIPSNQIYAYTDSTIVLAWIQSQPIRWQTFVANRITEIQTRLDNDRWNHVASAENPADIASRGIEPSELQVAELWWNGPHWMRNPNIHINKIQVPETTLEERKQQTKVFHNNTEESILNRFSSFKKMIRVLTYCRRFLNLKENKENRNKMSTYLTAEEMKTTLGACIKTTQETEFAEELEDLKTKGKVKRSSKLITLTPYIDDKGLLRVGGRLQSANISQNYKHPIIIPKNTHLGDLLIRDAHERVMHGGTALTINYLKSKYWIIGLKQSVKKYLSKCVTCTRYNARTQQPIMGELPSVRVTPGRAFECCGVDFAGPIQMRVSKGRGQKSYKGYISLFVCMKTKAIHLEAVSDLTTPGFIAAFRRFVSRRGHCAEMWSDNGLNFVGAANELTKMLNQSMTNVLKEIAEMLENDGTKWHFIPPKSPNFGGLWESGVKSVKAHLMKTIGNSTLTFEEFSTVLCQIEAVLNSRPISSLSDDPNDTSPLTPSHFLVGEPLIVIPEPNNISDTISPLQRWKLTQRMTKCFWNRWSKEYLNTLQQKHKWHTKVDAPKVGDLVVIKETDLPPAKWLLGRITQLHPGPDDQVRVVSLKCRGSTLKRPVSKLILLP